LLAFGHRQCGRLPLATAGLLLHVRTVLRMMGALASIPIRYDTCMRKLNVCFCTFCTLRTCLCFGFCGILKTRCLVSHDRLLTSLPRVQSDPYNDTCTYICEIDFTARWSHAFSHWAKRIFLLFSVWSPDCGYVRVVCCILCGDLSPSHSQGRPSILGVRKQSSIPQVAPIPPI